MWIRPSKYLNSILSFIKALGKEPSVSLSMMIISCRFHRSVMSSTLIFGGGHYHHQLLILPSLQSGLALRGCMASRQYLWGWLYPYLKCRKLAIPSSSRELGLLQQIIPKLVINRKPFDPIQSSKFLAPESAIYISAT